MKCFGVLLTTGVLFLTVQAASAATITTYTASDGPDTNPDANGGSANVWTQTITPNGGAAGSYYFAGTGWNANSWVIWSSQSGNADQTVADIITLDHTFAGGPLTVGQQVSIDFANAAVQDGSTGSNGAGSVGVALLSGTTEVVRFSFTGGDPDGVYRYTDNATIGGSTGKGFVYQGSFNVSFTLTGLTSYSGNADSNTWTGTYTGPIDGFRVFNVRGADGSDVATNNLTIADVPEPATLALAALGALALCRRR